MCLDGNGVAGNGLGVSLCVASEMHDLGDDAEKHVDGRFVLLRVEILIRERDTTL